MRLLVDLTGKKFTVGRAPEPKTEQGGKQRQDKENGEPLWMTQLVAMDETGAEVIMVTTTGHRPDVEPHQPVTPRALEAFPWSMVDNGKHRHGVSYRAAALIVEVG